MLPDNFLEAAQKVQEELQKGKENFDVKKFNYSYQNGDIKIEIMGSKRITKIDIKEELYKNHALLEALLISSINDAHDNVNKSFEEVINNINEQYASSFEGLM